MDDERNIRTTLTVCLEDLGCTVTAVANAEQALAAIEREPFDLAFLDLKLGTDSGLELLPRLRARRPDLDVVIITAYAAIETAVEAMKRGAFDYLPKPFSPAQVRLVVRQSAERRALEGRVSALEAALAREVPEVDLETRAPAMRAALELVRRAASADAAVLLRGESGTGKGVLALALHEQSARRARPFVTVNCPTLTDELLASELFGHAKGAFTGAVRDQVGRVEAAEGGTLFLDEIGEISPNLQAKLLRFLQTKQFERVGESVTRRADVRVVAATNRDLEADVRAGHFREDLLFRLNVIEIRIPSLRERAEDIPVLAERFLRFFARASGRAAPSLTNAAVAALAAYPWPGNLRELRNAMERATILWPATTIGVEALPERIGGAAPDPRVPTLGGDFTLDEIEREHLTRVLHRAHSLDEAARVLGVDPSTLYRKRKKLDE
ncbi:MAG: sigma-54-dependent Fis family transcriptional regulator [Deltaproteobacteria bacterium]|nr:sigma-54-dependent Fis family transcriptional regulator [Deltaproteobacteria bacterium]